MITYGSVCSGIEAASVAWEGLGWRPAWFAQFDPEHNYKKGPDFPSAVLAYRWPDVANLGDMTKIAAAIRAGHVDAPDVLVGGTPCQAFSIAGLRNGLSDSRGQLTLAFFELVNAIDEKRRENGKPPVIVVWENVPGVLNTKDNAFGCFLAGLAGESRELESPRERWTNAGYVLGPERAVCWRVLDAQFFGVAQRRRRVFVVASARTDIDPAKILFESEGVRRDIEPRREAKKTVTSIATDGAGAGRRASVIKAFRMSAFGEYADDETASTIKARDHKDATDLAVAYSDTARTLLAKSGISMAEDLETYAIHGTQDPDILKNIAHTLGRNSGQENAVISGDLTVRRLTVVECERLQGFPDNYTLIPRDKRKQITADKYAYLRHHFPNMTAEEAYRQAEDGPRYKAIGNSMAVPVMRWIGSRIQEALCRTR